MFLVTPLINRVDNRLIIGFGFLPVTDLIRCGLNVHAFNQRTVAGIFDMIRMLGAMVDAGGRAEELVATLEAGLVQARGPGRMLTEAAEGIFRGVG
jgi:iron complex transport system substrate-binding protein